jgi:predicted nucleotidyltransferase
MKSFGWEICPPSALRQIRDLLAGLQERLERNLTGLYLHGSLAMGCFNPQTSDIDLLAAVGRTIPPETKRSLVEFLLGLSGSPHPLEISFLRPEDLLPWRHPAASDLHYSEEWRKRYTGDSAADAWAPMEGEPRTDPDLAAHITVLRARGIRLAGKPIADVFPAIPRKDYLAALLEDLGWAQTRAALDPVYGVLNACRVHAYLQDGSVCSKAEGATRGRATLPAEFHPLMESALAVYGGGMAGQDSVDPDKAKRLMTYVISEASVESASKPGAESTPYNRREE